jgi:hypothetical protein
MTSEDFSMDDTQRIKQLQDRVDLLEGLLHSLVAKNESSISTGPTSLAANGVQSPAPSTNEQPAKEAPCLQNLPTELRINILEMALPSDFANKPWGLVPKSPLPIIVWHSKTRLPAILHVGRTMRSDGVKIFLKRAQKMIDGLETENRKFYEVHTSLVTQSARSRSQWCYRLETDIGENWKILLKLESMCDVVKGRSTRACVCGCGSRS